MDTFLSAVAIVPGILALLLLGAFAYFYKRNRDAHRNLPEDILAFSHLDVDSTRLLTPAEIAPALERILQRLLPILQAERAAIYLAGPWRSAVPTVQRGFSANFISQLESSGAGDHLSDISYRRGGLATFLHAAANTSADARAVELRNLLQAENAPALTALSLQTRSGTVGAILFAHDEARKFGTPQLRVMLGLAMQIGMTLENYVLMHDAQRRTKEYELLTQIGQVISSRLDPDEVLLAIHKELGQLFDTGTFYIAFQEADEIRFEFDVTEGVIQPKRSRKPTNGITEYILRTGQPVLVRSDMESFRQRAGVGSTGRPSRCYCGVPIQLAGRTTGVMAAMHYDREFVYDQRDLDVLKTAAGQVAVAFENARLFAEEHRRARYLGFLNNISKLAISSQDAEQMLAEIVAEIQKNFHFDHIGIGILDFATKDIEIRAEAGSTEKALGKRIPLGVGILGRTARTGEVALVQNTGEGHLLGIMRDSRSVLCIPIVYGETMMGVLNVESKTEGAFAQQEVLILRTLADLLATALHNALVFQKMQQQSITDGLTGIKTRRFFLESVQAEWKRASRSGRPFSVVLIDLDKFKEVNDGMGHLEGDLVLARIGRLLEQKCRQSNVVARYGGDEFVILMPETSVEQAQILSERLRLWVATDPMLNERHITGSFGVASFPLHGSTVEDIIRVADAGMYVSKHAGGNRVSTAEEIPESESAALHKQRLAAYVEGFLQREHTGPEYAEELIGTLRKLCDSVQQDSDQVDLLMDAIIAFSRAVESREVHSAGHGDMVARLAEAIGREAGMAEDELLDLVFAAKVHDVGKIVIPERLLNKAGSFTEDEYHIVKMHSKVGAEIVQTIPGSKRLAPFVLHHHERFDGSGYPDGLRGEQIPLGARIIGLADAYVNMTTERPFAPARTQPEAFQELEKGSGTLFDSNLVRLLVHELRGEKAARTGD